MRVLVLCVDRDDDVGTKTKIKGPIVGEKKVLEAAQALALADPADTDANAMFETVRTFLELKKDALEVACITGHKSRGYKADKEIARQLDEILEKIKPDGVFLVTDGADDDSIIPIIQSRTKIVSKKTLIVRQAKELEKSYYVIKQVLADPYFARIIFGLPGLILLTLVLLQELGVKMILLITGTYLILKGFGIEEIIINGLRNWRESLSIERASFPLYFGGAIIFVLGVWSGVDACLQSQQENLIKLGSVFLDNFMHLGFMSFLLIIFGKMGDMHYKKNIPGLKKYVQSLATILSLWIVVFQTNNLIKGEILIDEFLGWVTISVLIAIFGISFLRELFVKKYIAPKIKKDMDVYTSKNEKIGKVLEVNKKEGFFQTPKGKVWFKNVVDLEEDKIFIIKS
ncbi:MAG: DUF373 family protein [archaeon]